MQRKILIVDDSAVNRTILKAILQQDFIVLEAASGDEALTILHSMAEEISAVLLDIMMPGKDGYQVLAEVRASADLAQLPVIVNTGDNDSNVEVKCLNAGATDFVTKPYRAEVILRRVWNCINIRETSAIINATRIDALTGLLSRAAFFDKVTEMLAEKQPGYYIMALFDIDGFKVINDQYGNAKGDEVLVYLAKVFQSGFGKVGGICSRVSADDFAVLYPREFADSPENKHILRRAAAFDGSISMLSFSIGRYVVDDYSLSPSAMLDRAILAQQSVKGSFDNNIAFFNEAMRRRILDEMEISAEMNIALHTGQFEAWYQPQYNHATGALIGAEALVRWRHPGKGLIPPSEFIPIFERNGFIYELDKCVWEQACAYQRAAIDEGRCVLPLSVNVSRADIFKEDFVTTIHSLIIKYGISPDLLHLEITESAFAKSTLQIINVVKELIALGFTLQIDDFGSGYSSLNTLKDVPAQVIKLDMRFLEGNINSTRGGNILESVVRMAKWLGMTVIAEGVETAEQADFLNSIGCNYVQGYLYAKPMPAADYSHLGDTVPKEVKRLSLETVDRLDNNTFWDPSSMDTLIFNSYIGGACILEFNHNNIELLRVNKKYVEIIGGSGMTVDRALTEKWFDNMDAENSKRVLAALNEAISTGKDIAVDVEFYSSKNGYDRTYIRAMVRMIAHTESRYLIYCTIDNITAERLAEKQRQETAEQLSAILASVGSGVSAATFKDNKTEYLFANDLFYSMFGYTKSRFEQEVPLGLPQNIVQEDLYIINDAAAYNLSTGKEITIEFRVRKRSGEIIWVRTTSTVCYLSNVSNPVFLAVINDITAEREQAEALIASSERLRILNDVSHNLLTQLDSDVAISQVLNNMLEYFGGAHAYVFEFDGDKNAVVNTYSAGAAEKDEKTLPDLQMEEWTYILSAFSAKDFVMLSNKAAVENYDETAKAILFHHKASSMLAVPLYRDGAIIGFTSVDNPTKNESNMDSLTALGDFVAVMLTRRDLRAKIQSSVDAELALMNDTPGGFARIKLEKEQWKLVYANDGLCKLMEISNDEVVALYGKDSIRAIHPDDVHIVKEAYQNMLQRDGRAGFVYRLRKGNGNYVSLMVFARLIKESNGDVFLNMYFNDVTEKTRSEELGRDLLDNLPCGAGLYEYDGKRLLIVHLNRRYREMVGRELEDMTTANLPEYVHPDDVEPLFKRLKAAAKSGKDANWTFRILHGDGSYHAYNASARFIPKTDKISVYVTYIPSLQAGLSFSEMIPYALSAIMDSSSDLSFVKDKDLRYICCSKMFANMVGVDDPVTIVGKTDFDIFEDVSLAEKYRDDDLRIMASGQSVVDMLERIPSNDGLQHYSSTSKYLLHDEKGNLIGLYGVGRDVTQYRSAFEQLKLLTDSLPCGLASFSVSYNGVTPKYLSDGIYKLLGYDKDVDHKVNPINSVFEEDRQVLRTEIENIMDGARKSGAFFRIHTPDGSFKWIEMRGTVTERRGDTALVNFAFLDVTEQRLGQQKERIHSLEMRVAMAQMGKMICEFDPYTLTLTVPQQYADWYGMPVVMTNVPYSIKDLGLFTPDYAEEYVEFYHKMLRGETNGFLDMPLTRRDGTVHWEHLEFISICADDGTVGKILISVEDTTRHEETKRNYEQELQLRTELMHDSILYYELNITKGLIEEYHSKFHDIPSMSADAEYTEKLRNDILRNIYFEDEEKVKNTLFSAALKEAYQRGETDVEVVYRRNLYGQGRCWVKGTAKIMKRPVIGDLVAFIYVSNIDVEKKNAIALDCLIAEEIERVGVLNLTSGQYRVIMDEGKSVNSAPIDYVTEAVPIFLSNIAPDDRESSATFFALENIKTALTLQPTTEHYYLHKSNEGRLYRKRYIAFYLDDAKQDIIFSRRDITAPYEESQRQQRILQQTADAANSANRAKSEFLSRMSHDMRTPLNAVLAFSDRQLTEDADRKQLLSHMEGIHLSGEYLLGIIDDMLDMSAIEQDKIAYVPVAYPLKEFGKTMETVIGELCRQRNLTFDLAFRSVSEECIMVDRLRFNQLFISLLSNAVKFTPTGGKVGLSIELTENGGEVYRFIVSDTGIGMSKEFIPHAFEAFSQENRAQAFATYHGTGLGLSIAKEIVKKIGGNISIESQINSGTKVTVELPLKKALKGTIPAPAPLLRNCLEGRKVLLCEDNKINTAIAVNMLEKQGCLVECTENGRKGFEAFMRSDVGYYDAVLMDIRMPVMNGIEATRAIRNTKRADAKTIPIIAMTADAFSEDEAASLRIGMNAHLPKPVEPTKLYETLLRFMKPKE